MFFMSRRGHGWKPLGWCQRTALTLQDPVTTKSRITTCTIREHDGYLCESKLDKRQAQDIPAFFVGNSNQSSPRPTQFGVGLEKMFLYVPVPVRVSRSS